MSLDYWRTVNNWQINFLAEGFYTDLNDVFALVEMGRDENNNLLFERVNEKGARIMGVNLEMRVTNGDKWNMQAGYTIQKSRYKDAFEWSESVVAQKRMFNSPDNYGYATIDYKPIKKLTLTLNGVYTGSMLMQHCAGAIEEYRDEITRRFFDISFRAAYDFKITNKLNFRLFGAVKNILDQYQPDLDFGMDKDSKYFYGPQLPRSYTIGGKLYF